jgi:hypothetical protein
MYGLRSKLVCLFVQPSVIAQAGVFVQAKRNYYEICHFSVDYGFIMFYSTGTKFVGRFILIEYQMESKRADLAVYNLKFLGINQVDYIRRKSKTHNFTTIYKQY